jgi:hypothetical protein
LIKGAIEILGEIPAIYLNPFLVAESQQEAMLGYIVIGYNPGQAFKSYDLLFLRGPEVFECVTLDDSRRERTDISAARERFKSSSQQDGTLVYLFRAEPRLMQQFITTVHIQPDFKVRVDSLSRRQIPRILRSVNCTHALVERNDFSQKLPSVEFLEINPQSGAPEFHMGFKRGGFLLYDYEALKHAPGVHLPEIPGLQTEFAFVVPSLPILTASHIKPKRTKNPIEVDRKSSPIDLDRTSKPIDVDCTSTPTEVDNTSSSDTVDNPELLLLFSRLLRSFRQQAFECVGTKFESVFVEAERRVKLNNPGFAADSMNAATAPLVLDLIEYVIEETSLFKRAKIRAAALSLIAEVYNKQYELLERWKAIEKVEQVYYRMKR